MKEIPKAPSLNAIAFNRAGISYFSAGKWQEACLAFQSAIEIAPDYIDAYYNLGLTFNKLKQWPEAAHTYEALLKLEPDHLGAQFQLGCLSMRKEDYQQASRYFSQLLKDYPDHIESEVNLASCYLKLGRLHDAKIHCLNAFNMNPADTQVLFNLGVISMQEGQVDAAIDYYLKAISIDPDLLPVHQNLGFIFLVKKERDRALLHFREVLRVEPDNKAVQHTISILTGNKEITTSPPEYVRALFDSYAEHFDAHLQQALHYQVPQLMYELVKSKKEMQPKSLDVLDLGCGTGLCGEYFRPFARNLVGVDLSANMLLLAKQKNIYDELACEEILTFLADKKAVYDLVIAGDVLVYIGDLAAIFAAIFAALHQGGCFVFDLEVNEADDYGLTPSGRFAHAKSYIDRLLKAQHFNVLHYEVVHLRTQNQEAVLGHLYLVEKPSMIGS